MATRKRSEPFSNVDAAWLHMDVPTNMAMITGVMMFDEPLDYERLKATIQYRLLPFKRFRQRIKESRLPLRAPRWEFDPNFDLNAHLHRIALPAPGGDAALQELAGDMMSVPLDFSKPLWQFHYVENYNHGCAIIARLHHCIADGLTLVQVLLSMADADADAPWPEPPDMPQRSQSLLARMLVPPIALVGKALHATETLLQEGLDTLDRPSRVLDAAKLGLSGTRALGKLLLILPDRKTLFKGKCGVAKRAAWSTPLSLREVKAVGQAVGATVNDVLLSAVSGGLRRYLEERGEKVGGVDIRAVVPVTLQSPEELDYENLGNHFGLVFLSLPIGIKDPFKRLPILKQRMDAIKNSPEAVVAFGILNAIGMTPTQIENIIVDIFGMKATGVMTNVPGPRQVIYLAGSPLRRIMFWVPQPGGLGLGVSIISYAGEVILGVATDAGLVPDPEKIIAGFHDEFDQMKSMAAPVDFSDSRAASKSRVLQAEGAEPGRCQALTQKGERCKNQALPGSTTCRRHTPLVT